MFDWAYWLTMKPQMIWLKWKIPQFEIYPTGSRYICSPPVINTDIDFVIYCEKNAVRELNKMGYKQFNLRDYFKNGKWEFTTWRKSAINLIISNSKEFVERHRVATHICKKYNLTDKGHRIVVHDIIRDGVHYEDLSGLQQIKLINLMTNLQGSYGKVLYETYKIKNGLKE